MGERLRHRGFRQWAEGAREIELQWARRSFQQLIAEHQAKLEQSIWAGEEEPVRHLEIELRAFREQLSVVEGELTARGIER